MSFSILPRLMPQGLSIELLAVVLPERHEAVHVAHELLVVVAFEQMHHFVDDDVLQAMHGFFDQFEVQPDTPCLAVAGAPFRFHLFHAPFVHLHTDDGFPFRDQGRDLFLEPLTIPGGEYALSLSGRALAAYEEVERLVVAHDHFRRAFVVDDIEQVTASLVVVALTAHIFARGLALLRGELRLLALDPGQSGDGKEAYRFVIDAQWCGHPDASGRWIDAEMQVLDVLANHIDDQAIDGDLVPLSTHLDSSQSPISDLSAHHLPEHCVLRGELPAP